LNTLSIFYPSWPRGDDMSHDEPLYSHEEFMLVVGRLFTAMTDPETKALEAELSLDALAFAAATLLDMHPNLAVPSRMRTAAEQHGSVVFTYLKWMRKHFEEKGVRFGELIGGETHLMGDLPPGHARH